MQEIDKYLNTKNKKKINKMVDYINDNHINHFHKLLDTNKIRTFESIGMEYISDNNFWDYDSMYKVSVNLSIIKNKLKKSIENNSPIKIFNNVGIINKNFKGLNLLEVKNDNYRNEDSIFSSDSPNKNNDILSYIDQKLIEKLYLGIPINFFNFFILFENKKNNFKIIMTPDGIKDINED